MMRFVLVEHDMTRDSSVLQVSQEIKPSYFPLYCLFNRDPYNGLLLLSAYNWVV